MLLLKFPGIYFCHLPSWVKARLLSSFLVRVVFVLGCFLAGHFTSLASVSHLNKVPLPTIELDLRDSLSLDLALAIKRWGFRSDHYNYRCLPRCPTGLLVSSEGMLIWNPEAYRVNSKMNREQLSKSLSIQIREKDIPPSNLDEAIIGKWRVKIDFFPYRGGQQWERFAIGDSRFKRLPIKLQKSRFLLASQSYQGLGSFGTAIYLGYFHGEHLVLTNDHVFESITRNGKGVCDRKRHFTFSVPGIDAYCKELVFKDRLSDIAILSIASWPSHDLNVLIDYTLPISFLAKEGRKKLDSPVPLLIAGHGRYRNPTKELRFGYDSDCQSDGQLIRFMKKAPFSALWDQFKKGLQISPVRSISYKLAKCDVSPGDSGGPVIRMDTGALVGIIRGGVGRDKIVKPYQEEPTYPNAIFIPTSTIKSSLLLALEGGARSVSRNSPVLTSLLKQFQGN